MVGGLLKEKTLSCPKHSERISKAAKGRKDDEREQRKQRHGCRGVCGPWELTKGLASTSISRLHLLSFQQGQS